jgi:hypothetical protein
LAPEAKEANKFSKGADVWSFGMVPSYFECLMTACCVQTVVEMMLKAQSANIALEVSHVEKELSKANVKGGAKLKDLIRKCLRMRPQRPEFAEVTQELISQSRTKPFPKAW